MRQLQVKLVLYEQAKKAANDALENYSGQTFSAPTLKSDIQTLLNSLEGAKKNLEKYSSKDQGIQKELQTAIEDCQYRINSSKG